MKKAGVSGGFLSLSPGSNRQFWMQSSGLSVFEAEQALGKQSHTTANPRAAGAAALCTFSPEQLSFYTSLQKLEGSSEAQE